MRPLADILAELHTTKAQLDTIKERGGDVDEVLTLAEQYRQLSLELEQSRRTAPMYQAWINPWVWTVPQVTYHFPNPTVTGPGWYSAGILPYGINDTAGQTFTPPTLTTLPAEE